MLVELHGHGPRVTFVHGAIMNGPASWAKQLSLAERWELAILTRPGFAPNPPTQVCDFASDAVEVVGTLDRPSHLVGHSYGGLIALLAAAARPDAVRSLTLLEPAAFALMPNEPFVAAAIAEHEAAVAAYGHDPRAFMADFTERLGGDPTTVPDPLPGDLRQNVELLIHERHPWEASIPVEALAHAAFRTLVVSGDHNPMQELMCDALAAAIGANAERVVIAGRGHNIQRTGSAFNDVLEGFLTSA